MHCRSEVLDRSIVTFFKEMSDKAPKVDYLIGSVDSQVRQARLPRGRQYTVIAQKDSDYASHRVALLQTHVL
jgi:hypothetical protein